MRQTHPMVMKKLQIKATDNFRIELIIKSKQIQLPKRK